MLARCSRCSHTFPIERYGRQRCPSCGTEVMVREPGAPAPPVPPDPFAPPAAPPQAPEPPEAAEALPWERRAELGLWPALWQTAKLALGEPDRLFGRMRRDTAEGALSFFFFVAVLPMLLGQVAGAVYNRLVDPTERLRQATELARRLGYGEMVGQWEELYRQIFEWQRSPLLLAVSLAGLVAAFYAALYVGAGLNHLILLVLGRAGGGWTATFKAFVYSSTPMVFVLVPACGGLVALLWTCGLEIYALARAHRIGGAPAAAAVLTPLVLLCCCVPTLLSVLVAAAGGFAVPR